MISSLVNPMVNEQDYLFLLSPKFKQAYRSAVSKAVAGDQEALLEQHRLIGLLTSRINAHLGDGMDKPAGIERGIIF